MTQSPNLETHSPNQPAVDKKPKVIRRPPFPMIMNREVLASRASDHSILTVQTPDGPIISANVMCSGEDYDPNMANSFRINPYAVEGRRERFQNMVAQLKHSKEQVNRPIIALQEFPRRSSTGSGELEFMLRQEFIDYRLIFGMRDSEAHEQSQLCFLVPRDIHVEEFNFKPRIHAIRINNTAYINVHPGPNRSKTTPDPFQEQLKEICNCMFDLGCEAVHIIGDWNRNRRELEHYWGQITSADAHSHYPPAAHMDAFEAGKKKLA